MRHLLLALPLVTLTACFADLDIEPIFTCDRPLFPTEACVDSAHPVDFYDDAVLLADGGEAALEVLTLDGLAFTIASDTPTIVEVVAAADGTFALRGRAAGIGRISARRPDGTSLAALPVEVRPIAAIDVRFDPAGAGPLTTLAALPGATERLRIVAHDADRRELAGAARVVELATTGPLALARLDQAERRAGSVALFNQVERPGFEAAVRFDRLGAGTVIARAGGVELATVAIDVIPAAATVELVPATPTATVGWFQLVDLVGVDARGVPVAGLIGDFTVSPAGLVTMIDDHAGEASMQTIAPGLATVTAVLPDRTVTTTFTISAQ